MCKNAIITSPHEGDDEVILPKKTGLLLTDTEQISKALSQLLAHPALRKELAEKAYAFIRDRFSWGRAVELYVEVMQKLQT